MSDKNGDYNSDSEDDIPIAELVKRSIENNKENKEKSKKSNEQANKKIKTEPINNKKSTNNSKESNNNSSSQITKSQPRSEVASATADFYENTNKEEDIANPPPGYEALDGFQGVFVSTRMDTLGHILDLRNKQTCPCLSNLIKKSSLELKELCIRAIENQMKALKEAEGEDCVLIYTLKAELADIKQINPEKADKEAEKFKNLIIK
eukprot:gene18073-23721_t